jgi:hypothetical protein
LLDVKKPCLLAGFFVIAARYQVVGLCVLDGDKERAAALATNIKNNVDSTCKGIVVRLLFATR